MLYHHAGFATKLPEKWWANQFDGGMAEREHGAGIGSCGIRLKRRVENIHSRSLVIGLALETAFFYYYLKNIYVSASE